MIGFSEGKGSVRVGAVIVNAGREFIWAGGMARLGRPKIVVAIAVELGDTRFVCKIASPFQDMVNPQVNLFQ